MMRSNTSIYWNHRRKTTFQKEPSTSHSKNTIRSSPKLISYLLTKTSIRLFTLSKPTIISSLLMNSSHSKKIVNNSWKKITFSKPYIFSSKSIKPKNPHFFQNSLRNPLESMKMAILRFAIINFTSKNTLRWEASLKTFVVALIQWLRYLLSNLHQEF